MGKKGAPKAAAKAAGEPKEAEEPKAEEAPASETAEAAPATEATAEAPKEAEAKEDVEMKAETQPKVNPPPRPEPPKELEADAAPSQGPKIKAGSLAFHTEDTTLNVIPAVNGKLLTSLSDGGFQYLLAGARASVGVKAGRYVFETVVVENRGVIDAGGRQPSGRRQVVRVGVSTAEASLLLGDGLESVYFDADGMFGHGQQRHKASDRFGQNQVVAILLNLDASSPNAHTISLFINGARASKPMALPEQLKGKALYPTVSYRNVTLQAHFGPQLLKPLPFVALSWAEAQQSDAAVKAAAPAPKDGKYEVVFPVGVPDEGTFDWVDQFLAKNKGYTELSDRVILDWAAKSGLLRQGAYKRSSNDKPEYNFGLPPNEDISHASINRVLSSVAPLLPRNFVVMEVKGNLLAEDRKTAVARFATAGFRPVAHVAVGEPTTEFRKSVQDSILAEKRQKAEAEARRKKAEAARKKAEELRKKKVEEERKKRIAAFQKAKEAKKEGEEEAEKKEEEPKEEEAPAEAEVEEEEPEVHVELTEEEQSLKFRRRDTPDLAEKDLASSFTKFSLPSADEGFAAVTFHWDQEAKAKAYLENWVQDRKLTQRIDDLQPSAWFQERWTEFCKVFASWKKTQQDVKDPVKRKAAAAAKKKELEEKAKEQGEGEGEDVAMPEEAKEVNWEELDVYAVQDILNVGNGEPLFTHWAFEDWTLCGLRYELHLLAHAFRKDVNDPQRSNFHTDHLPFYYNKYFKKFINVKYFGVNKISELIALVKDTVQVNASSHVLESVLSEDLALEDFVKFTEDHRRDRQRRVDAGDETALLKFTKPPFSGPQPPRQPPKAATAPGRVPTAFAPRAPSAVAPGPFYTAAPLAQRPGYAPAPQVGQKRPFQQATYAAQSYPAKQPRFGGPQGGGKRY